ncbi:MAG: restriction endonuclease subunit S [Verrucomicrobia bacterium]|nr:restriction endonuclease subunit S [Verrucomicrobiota bacterium]
MDKLSNEIEEPVRLCNYTDVYHREFISPELPLMEATATLAEIRRFHLESGDVVITKDSESWDDIAVPALIEGTAPDLVCGYHLAMIRGRSKVMDGRFLFRCFQSGKIRSQLEIEAKGVTRYGLPNSAIGDAVLPVPPLPIQRRIAAYLDRETAQIDALVAQKGMLLGLLEEKRASLISHAVTRGLNPKAKLKPSGIPWLGEVPVHWEVVPLKRLTRNIKTGTTPNTDDVTADGDFDWFTPGDFGSDIHLTPSKRRIFRSSASFDSLRVFPAGTILFVGIGATLGKCSVSLTDCSANQQINAIVPTPETNSVFLCLSLRAKAEGIRLMANASTIGILNQERTAAIPVAVPPPAEQTAIAAECLRISAATDRALSEIQTSIALLREKRSSLISAAVTGEMEVVK